MSVKRSWRIVVRADSPGDAERKAFASFGRYANRIVILGVVRGSVGDIYHVTVKDR